jgi:hypothetical protein
VGISPQSPVQGRPIIFEVQANRERVTGGTRQCLGIRSPPNW